MPLFRWPWRSRPVITPFRDDYSARVLTYAGPWTSRTFSIYIPDDLYIIPSAIHISIDAANAIRATTASYLYFYRGSVLYNGCIFDFIVNNLVQDHFIVTGVPYPPAARPRECKEFYLPTGIHCYPRDRLFFDLPSQAAGDIIGPIHIHGKTWEIV